LGSNDENEVNIATSVNKPCFSWNWLLRLQFMSFSFLYWPSICSSSLLLPSHSISSISKLLRIFDVHLLHFALYLETHSPLLPFCLSSVLIDCYIRNLKNNIIKTLRNFPFLNQYMSLRVPIHGEDYGR
jgi:hypothetical protein